MMDDLDPTELRRATTKMKAEFPTAGAAQFSRISGDAGYISASAGAKVAIMSRWKIDRSGADADGKPRFRLRASFSWVQAALMNLVSSGRMKGRPVLQMKTVRGLEDVDIDSWSEWRYEDGLLTLEDIQHIDARTARFVSGPGTKPTVGHIVRGSK